MAPNRSMSRILAGLDPEPLRIERDELFFQAGMAAARSLSTGERAGVRGLNSLRLWQATAAALLVACIGLSTTAFRQGMISTTDSSSGISTGATAGLPSSGSARGTDINDHFLTDRLRTRKWQQLASADFLPPGRLTALGWSELSSEELAARSRASAESPQESDTSPTSSRLTPELLKSLHLPHEG